MLRDLASQKKIDPETITAAIKALQEKGWDINPYTVADEAKIPRSTLYRSTELMDIVSAARGEQAAATASTPPDEQVSKLERRVAELESLIEELKRENASLVAGEQQAWQAGYQAALHESKQRDQEASSSADASQDPSSSEHITKLKLETATQQGSEPSLPPDDRTADVTQAGQDRLQNLQTEKETIFPAVEFDSEYLGEMHISQVLQAGDDQGWTTPVFKQPSKPAEPTVGGQAVKTPVPSAPETANVWGAPQEDAREQPAQSAAASSEEGWAAELPPGFSKDQGWSSEPPPANADDQGWSSEPPPANDSDQGWLSEPPPANDSDQGWTSEPPPANDSDQGWSSEPPPANDSDQGWSSEPPPANADDQGWLSEPPPGYSDDQGWSAESLVEASLEEGSEQRAEDETDHKIKTTTLTEDDLRDLLKHRFGKTEPEQPEKKEEDAGKKPAGTRFVGGHKAHQEPPPPGYVVRSIPPDIRKACLVLGLRPEELTLETVHRAWKKEMTREHPDIGGDTEIAVYLNTAKETLFRWLEAQAPKLGKKFGSATMQFKKPDLEGSNDKQDNK